MSTSFVGNPLGISRKPMTRHRTIVRLSTVLAVVALAQGCGDGDSATAPPTPEPARPTTVSVSPATDELTALGATVQLSAEVRDQNATVMAGATVIWTSSAISVATVDASGLVTAAGNGTATITASAGSASGSAVVTVTQLVASVEVSPSVDELTALGATVQLTAEAFDRNEHVVAGSEFSWESSDVAVATVDAGGLVTGVAEGVATITASAGEASGSAVVTVAQVVSAIEMVSGDGQSGLTGEALSEPVVVRVLDSGGAPVAETTVTFEPEEGHGTASPATAVSDADGQAQATWTLGEFDGTQTLTASIAGGPSTTITATAAAVVATVTITPNPADVIVEFDIQLTASLRDRNGYEINGRTISWSSDDPSIAFVDASGVITGMSVGSTLVTATVEGLTGSTTVIVTAPIVTGIDIVAFLNQCPMSDPAYTQIREDFEVRFPLCQRT